MHPQCLGRTDLSVSSCVLLLILVLLPLRTAQAQPPAPPVRDITIGTSLQGRPITAVQVGNGARKLVVVGNTHGAPEGNTLRLTQELIAHFRAHPDDVPTGVRLYLIPTINPDGVALGTRFNAAGVDLNRNMDTTHDACPENDWQAEVFGAYGTVSTTGGPYADSEPESRLVRAFLLDAAGVIFIHSNAGLVFPALCEHAPSIAMAQTYAAAAGYTYQRTWGHYPIHGGMHDWAASMGMAAIVPELISATESEFDQNLAGLRAVLAQADTLLPLPQDHVVGSVVVPAVVWRYWQAHGGAAVFGMPLASAQQRADGPIRQRFTNATLELRPARADTLSLVEPLPLGVAWLRAQGNQTTAPAASAPDPRFVAYWEQHGAAAVWGMPLAPAQDSTAADGTPRTIQVFERGVLVLHTEDGSVRPEPVGWQVWHIEQVRAPWVVPLAR